MPDYKRMWLSKPAERLPVPGASHEWRKTGENVDIETPSIAALIAQGCITNEQPEAADGEPTKEAETPPTTPKGRSKDKDAGK